MRWDLSLNYGNGSINRVQNGKTTIWKFMNLSVNVCGEHLHENENEAKQKLHLCGSMLQTAWPGRGYSQCFHNTKRKAETEERYTVMGKTII